jgi:hypothetical protein
MPKVIECELYCKMQDAGCVMYDTGREGACMRTTLTIPDDVLAAARQRAQARGQTVGEALADMARRGLENELDECEDDFWQGVKLFPHRPGEPRITVELVNKLRDESV